MKRRWISLSRLFQWQPVEFEKCRPFPSEIKVESPSPVSKPTFPAGETFNFSRTKNIFGGWDEPNVFLAFYRGSPVPICSELGTNFLPTSKSELLCSWEKVWKERMFDPMSGVKTIGPKSEFEKELWSFCSTTFLSLTECVLRCELRTRSAMFDASDASAVNDVCFLTHHCHLLLVLAQNKYYCSPHWQDQQICVR